MLDCNSLHHFAEKYDIPDEKLVFPESSKQLVETIASFGAVAAIRLHASIVSYSLGVPSVNLNWNEKVPYFYDNIGYGDRIVPIDENSAENMAKKVLDALSDGEYLLDEEYLMSLYCFLYDALVDIFSLKKGEKYSFQTVCEKLASFGKDSYDYISDYTVKIKRGAHFYFKLFKEDRKKSSRIKALNAEKESLEKELVENEKILASKLKEVNALLEKEKENSAYLSRQADKYKEKYNEAYAQAQEYKESLERVKNMPLIGAFVKDKKESGKK